MNKLFLPLLAIIFFFGCAKEEAALNDAEKQQEFQLVVCQRMNVG